MRISERYWIPNLLDLFTHTRLIPSQQMSIGAKLNSVMRLTLLIFLAMMLLGYRFAVPFLVIASAMNVAFYLLHRKEYE